MIREVNESVAHYIAGIEGKEQVLNFTTPSHFIGWEPSNKTMFKLKYGWRSL